MTEFRRNKRLKVKYTGTVIYRLIQQKNGYWCSEVFIDDVREPDFDIHPQYAKANAVRQLNKRIERHNFIATKGKVLPIFDEQAEHCEVIAFNKPEIEPINPQQAKQRERMSKTSFIDDAEKEVQLLKIAKERYKNYADVKVLAQELGLPAGKVYLTLKAHSFISQNETTEYRVLDAYYKYNGNLKAIQEETGLTVWICAQTIKNLGLSPNWVSYKNRAVGGKQGDWAEEEFRRLVPDALDMNMQYQMNNPIFDFIVNGKTVDVKSSLMSERARCKGYSFFVRKYDTAPLPDFFCVFCVKDRDRPYNEGGNYHILLIPKEIIPDGKNRINFVGKGSKATSSFYWDFEVHPVALEATLSAITVY